MNERVLRLNIIEVSIFTVPYVGDNNLKLFKL